MCVGDELQLLCCCRVFICLFVCLFVCLLWLITVFTVQPPCVFTDYKMNKLESDDFCARSCCCLSRSSTGQNLRLFIHIVETWKPAETASGCQSDRITGLHLPERVSTRGSAKLSSNIIHHTKVHPSYLLQPMEHFSLFKLFRLQTSTSICVKNTGNEFNTY